jgi:hypothetical protein
MLGRADKAEEQTRKLLSALEAYLQPNPGFYLNLISYFKVKYES